ncbi:MAG: hypothetical protein WC903_08535 [Candidatus Margulisiibacteriota bacterium]
MAESQLNPSLTIATPFDEKERELIVLFERTNARLINILIGIVRVLNDRDNPDRFHQAAHSIRGITDILTRELAAPNNSIQDSGAQAPIHAELDLAFEKALALMPTSEIQVDKRDEHQKVERMFDVLKATLKNGAFSLKQKIRSYYGELNDILRLPKEIKEKRLKSIREWANTHNNYFVAHTHYGSNEISENDFIEKWDIIKSCLIDALSRFYERDVTLLDEAMSMEAAPNE